MSSIDLVVALLLAIAAFYFFLLVYILIYLISGFFVTHRQKPGDEGHVSRKAHPEPTG